MPEHAAAIGEETLRFAIVILTSRQCQEANWKEFAPAKGRSGVQRRTASEDLSQRDENERDKNERAVDVEPGRDGKAAARCQTAPNSD
jgi:hypothetical protein